MKKQALLLGSALAALSGVATPVWSEDFPFYGSIPNFPYPLPEYTLPRFSGFFYFLPPDSQPEYKCDSNTDTIRDCIERSANVFDRGWYGPGGMGLKFDPSKPNVVHTYYNWEYLGEWQAQLVKGTGIKDSVTSMMINIPIPPTYFFVSVEMKIIRHDVKNDYYYQYETCLMGNFPGIEYECFTRYSPWR